MIGSSVGDFNVLDLYRVISSFPSPFFTFIEKKNLQSDPYQCQREFTFLNHKEKDESKMNET